MLVSKKFMERLDSIIEGYKNEIDLLKMSVEDLVSDIKYLKITISKKDNEIARLKRKIKTLENGAQADKMVIRELGILMERMELQLSTKSVIEDIVKTSDVKITKVETRHEELPKDDGAKKFFDMFKIVRKNWEKPETTDDRLNDIIYRSLDERV